MSSTCLLSDTRSSSDLRSELERRFPSNWAVFGYGAETCIGEVVVAIYPITESRIPLPEGWRDAQWSVWVRARHLVTRKCLSKELPMVRVEDLPTILAKLLSYVRPFVDGDLETPDWLRVAFVLACQEPSPS